MPTQPQLVIDLDLDTFVCPPVESGHDSYDRAPSADHKPTPRAQVEYFYESQLELKRSARTKGIVFDFHVDSYHWWRRLIQAGQLNVPFEVIHVDAHDDLLSGLELAYFFEEWTATPDKLQSIPRKLSSANYLGHAVANGWLSALTWVRRWGTKAEPSSWLFKDFSPSSGRLETKRFPIGGIAAASRVLMNGQLPRNFIADIEIPFTHVSFSHYHLTRAAEFIFVARSPSFTPVETDANEDLICDRIVPLHGIASTP